MSHQEVADDARDEIHQIDGFLAEALRGDICLEALTTTPRELGTPVPVDVIAELEANLRSGGPSNYLRRDWQGRRILADLRAIPGFEGRLSLLCKLLFLSRAYLRAKYPSMAGRPVALLYLRRILDALRRGWWAKHP
jgi:hypothetical protein